VTTTLDREVTEVFGDRDGGGEREWLPIASRLYRRVRDLITYVARDPDHVEQLFTISPTLGDTEEEARLREVGEIADAERRLQVGLASMSSLSGVDFSTFDIDEPIGEFEWTSIACEQMCRSYSARDRHTEGARGQCDGHGGPGGFHHEYSDGGDRRGRLSDCRQLLQPSLRNRYHRRTCARAPTEVLTRSAYSYEQFRDNLLAF
jgi:hypothetical protein